MLPIICSDIAIGFCSTWIKPFPILQIKFWDCAESRLFHKNANNSCLMMQWRGKINLVITVIKCLFMNTPVCSLPDNTGHDPALFTVPACLCPWLLAHLYILFLAYLFLWSQLTLKLSSDGKKIIKKAAARKPTTHHIFHSYYQNTFPLFSLHRDDIQYHWKCSYCPQRGLLRVKPKEIKDLSSNPLIQVHKYKTAGSDWLKH